MKPLSIFKKIQGLELKPFQVKVGLADGTDRNAKGVIENVIINVNDFSFPIKVTVMDVTR